MPPAGFERREDAVVEVCERLYLPPERGPEVEKALGDRLVVREGLWSSFPAFREVSTLWWDVDDSVSPWHVEGAGFAMRGAGASSSVVFR